MPIQSDEQVFGMVEDDRIRPLCKHTGRAVAPSGEKKSCPDTLGGKE
jgi:hypothetical protein